jgi:hypothetical protein
LAVTRATCPGSVKEGAGDHLIRRAVGRATKNFLASNCWERRMTSEVKLRGRVDTYDAAERSKCLLGATFVVHAPAPG